MVCCKGIKTSGRKQTEFVAAASHELRSPLAVIRANMAVIKNDKEQAEEFFRGMEQECKRMSRLIDDMLLLASADAKNWSFQRKCCQK